MTLKHYFTLHGIGSPFIHTLDFSPEDIAIFIWVMSPEYVPCKLEKKQFFKKVIKVKMLEAIDQIRNFLEMTFADADTAKDGDPSKYASFLTYQIDLFAKEYGWEIDYIMELPLRQIFQLNSAIGERYARQAGEKYTKLRAVDLMQAQHFFAKQKAKKEQASLN